jgi:hypothetical protein
MSETSFVGTSDMNATGPSARDSLAFHVLTCRTDLLYSGLTFLKSCYIFGDGSFCLYKSRVCKVLLITIQLLWFNLLTKAKSYKARHFS